MDFIQETQNYANIDILMKCGVVKYEYLKRQIGHTMTMKLIELILRQQCYTW